jgi:SAM-dependent methyltransferase
VESNQTHSFGSMEYYDNLWTNEWHDMERFNPTARHLERIIVKVLRTLGPIRSLIDVGCGIGVNMKRIHHHFPDLPLTGTDISPSGIELARRYVGQSPQLEYQVLNVETAALPAKYDVVLCSQVLEHIQDDVRALQHLKQMSSKYLLLTVPGGKYNSTSKLVGHYRHYTKKDLVDKVKSCGLEVMWAYEWGFPFHSVYKFLLDRLPPETQKSVGLGKYGWTKRTISNILFSVFYLNRFNRGANVILLAKVV